MVNIFTIKLRILMNKFKCYLWGCDAETKYRYKVALNMRAVFISSTDIYF